MVKRFIVTAAVEMANVAAVVEALNQTGVADAVTISMENGTEPSGLRAIVPPTDAPRVDVDRVRTAARRTLTTGRNLVAYVLSGRISPAQLKGMDLTPQQAKIAGLVARSKHGITCAEVSDASGIRRKSCESALYQLRHTKPAVIKSIAREE